MAKPKELRRKPICPNCPHQVDWHVDGAGPCRVTSCGCLSPAEDPNAPVPDPFERMLGLLEEIAQNTRPTGRREKVERGR
jgi:hypothetical protein